MSIRPNIDSLTDDVVNRLCHGHFKRKSINSEKLKVVDWDLQPFEAETGGLLSKPYILIVRCQRNDHTTIEEISFFIKSIPVESITQRDNAFYLSTYTKEIRIYRDILPLLTAAVHSEIAPHCYLTKEFNLLVFENLHMTGYKLADFEAGLLDEPHLTLALETLAKLHAASMIVEKKCNTRLNVQFSVHLVENAYPIVARNANDWLSRAAEAISALIPEIPCYSTVGRVAEIQKRFCDIVFRIYELCKTSQRYRNVFAHGDLWKNNLMFRYEQSKPSDDQCKKQSRLPVNAKFVDFQLSRYAPPALDLMTICTLTTTSAFREDRLDTLLEAYYNYLTLVLQQQGLNVEQELPRAEFDESCDFYRLAGLIVCCLFSNLVLLPLKLTRNIVSPAEEYDYLRQMTKSELLVTGFRRDAVYRKRMTDMISVIVDNFVMPNLGSDTNK